MADAWIGDLDGFGPGLATVFRRLGEHGRRRLTQQLSHLVVLKLSGFQLVWLHQKFPLPQHWVILSLLQRQLLEILAISFLLAWDVGGYRTIDGEYLRTPVKLAEILKEALKDLKRRIELLMEIVQQENDQNVQGIRGHICRMTPK